MIKSRRIRISQLAAFIAFIYYVFGVSVWNVENIAVEAVLYFIGVTLIAVGVVGRAWCLSYIAGNKNKKLIKYGPYSICRNPLYLFSLIGAVGVGFGTETLSFPIIIFVAFIIYYPSVIRKEEAVLKSKFGKDYEVYLKNIKTGLVPSFKNYADCERIEIKPKTFRRGVADLFFFIFILGVFKVIKTMHMLGIIPLYYYIY